MSGLVNLGNTCYINSVLQIMYHINELNDYIDQYNHYNKQTLDYVMTTEWKSLKDIMKKQVHISPNRFIRINRELFKKKNKIDFLENEQGDANEYFLFFIECIHNSYNLLDKKSYDNKFLQEYAKKDNSIISHIFLSLFEVQYIDEMKKKVSSSYEINWNLDVCIPQNNNLTLYDCLDFTFKEEYLCDDNAWLDDKTNEKKNVYKYVKMVYCPTILVISLKRWIDCKKKHKSKIELDPILDMSRYSNEKANYELFGVINHEGNLYGGHYFSFIKGDNQWFMFNDNQIKKIDTFIHPSNYCLFYRKIK
jgi:ubiquitin carboxyl-terminal hydrolase 2